MSFTSSFEALRIRCDFVSDDSYRKRRDFSYTKRGQHPVDETIFGLCLWKRDSVWSLSRLMIGLIFGVDFFFIGLHIQKNSEAGTHCGHERSM